VEVINIHESLPIAFSPSSDLIFAYVKEPVEAITHSTETQEKKTDILRGNGDISVVMRERAKSGYGGEPKINRELSAVFGDSELAYVWNWVYDMKYNLSKGKLQELKGIYSIIFGSKTSSSTFSIFVYVSEDPAAPTASAIVGCSYLSLARSLFYMFFSFIRSHRKTIRAEKETATDQGTQFSLFTSPERAFCLRLCGWGFQSDEDMLKSLNLLLQEGRTEKAIALAVFHMNIKLAISLISQLEARPGGGFQPGPGSGANALSSSGTLLTGAEPSSSSLSQSALVNLKLVAMALAGFSDGGGSLWRQSCEPLRSSIADPYLGAVFSFLSNTKPDYWTVLVESEMSLRDKIAFACRFLDDERVRFLKTISFIRRLFLSFLSSCDQLRQFLERTKVQLISQGRLNGLLLTGIDGLGGGVDLLQQFINRTGDIQTAALLCCHVSHRKIKDLRIQAWVQLYRGLLDRWQLWMQRAKLDVERGSVFELKPPAQVFLRCNYCNQSITLGRDDRTAGPGGAPGGPPSPGGPGMMGRNPMMGGMFGAPAARRPGGGPETKSKITSCPSCRKPLPKCSVCLLPMTATPPTADSRQSQDGGATWHSNPHKLDDWFMWCQTCRHGGHAGHLTDWFRFTDVCPVSDCNCKCQYMDRPNMIPASDALALIGESSSSTAPSSSSNQSSSSSSS
jgi:WD repeat-containing protein mio